jgi:hypothetical protein
LPRHDADPDPDFPDRRGNFNPDFLNTFPGQEQFPSALQTKCVELIGMQQGDSIHGRLLKMLFSLSPQAKPRFQYKMYKTGENTSPKGLFMVATKGPPKKQKYMYKHVY